MVDNAIWIIFLRSWGLPSIFFVFEFRVGGEKFLRFFLFYPQFFFQIRLDLQGGTVKAGVFQSTEIDVNYDIVTSCNYQTCNGCLDLNIQRLCYGAQV